VSDGEGALSFAFQLAIPGGVAGLCKSGDLSSSQLGERRPTSATVLAFVLDRLRQFQPGVAKLAKSARLGLRNHQFLRNITEYISWAKAGATRWPANPDCPQFLLFGRNVTSQERLIQDSSGEIEPAPEAER
jgi:hypothetical protein